MSPRREPTPGIWAPGAGQKVATSKQDRPQDTPSLGQKAALHEGLTTAVDALERGTLAERAAWLHGLIVTGSSWIHIVSQADKLAAGCREAAYVVDGIESPALDATDDAAVRASLAERAQRSSLVGRFVAQREDVHGGGGAR